MFPKVFTADIRLFPGKKWPERDCSSLIECPSNLLVFARGMPQFDQTETAEGIVHRSAEHSRVAVFRAAAKPKPIHVG
jgi:hypothetical protein